MKSIDKLYELLDKLYEEKRITVNEYIILQRLVTESNIEAVNNVFSKL